MIREYVISLAAEYVINPMKNPINNLISRKDTMNVYEDGGEHVGLPAENIRLIDAFAQSTYKSVYVWDCLEESFRYVSPLMAMRFGKTSEELLEGGTETCKEILFEEELEILRCVPLGERLLEEMGLQGRCDYSVSCDLHVRQGGGKRLATFRFVPFALDACGKVRLALCTISLSVGKDAGNAILLEDGMSHYWRYDFEKGCWDKKTKPVLTDMEKDVLLLSANGLTLSDIAATVHKSLDSVKTYRRALFRKLDVTNISSAITCAANYRLI